MIQAYGYVLRLLDDRHKTLESISNDDFAEPVQEFEFTRGIPLICFVINPHDSITHLAIATKGQSSGTFLSRLNLNQIIKLKKKVIISHVINNLNSITDYVLILKLRTGGVLNPDEFYKLFIVLIELSSEIEQILSWLTRERKNRIENLSPAVSTSLAMQKEAVLTALSIAGIDKSAIRGWDYDENVGPKSFLDGIKNPRLMEDSMILNDLMKFPGFDFVRTTGYSTTIFRNENTELEVILTNKLPLEQLLGTDLIYFNLDLHCFVMVQYKALERYNDLDIFRIPNKQLDEEIKRMDLIYKQINQSKEPGSCNEYRLNDSPFFLKFCPRYSFEPDNTTLSSGFYIPLEYYRIFQDNPPNRGKHGGLFISYHNVGRYFNNTEFKTLIERGWVGTAGNQTTIIAEFIRDVYENGKTAVIAIKKRLTKTDRKNNDEDRMCLF